MFLWPKQYSILKQSNILMVHGEYCSWINYIPKQQAQCNTNFHRYGYWGICFLYGTFFALSALASVGKTYNNSEAVRIAVKFFLSKQNEEGGWGESLEACPSEVISQIRFLLKNLVSGFKSCHVF